MDEKFVLKFVQFIYYFFLKTCECYIETALYQAFGMFQPGQNVINWETGRRSNILASVVLREQDQGEVPLKNGFYIPIESYEIKFLLRFQDRPNTIFCREKVADFSCHAFFVLHSWTCDMPGQKRTIFLTPPQERAPISFAPLVTQTHNLRVGSGSACNRSNFLLSGRKLLYA